MTDARNGKSPRSYVQSVLRYAKAAEFSSMYNQLTVAWSHERSRIKMGVDAAVLICLAICLIYKHGCKTQKLITRERSLGRKSHNTFPNIGA